MCLMPKWVQSQNIYSHMFDFEMGKITKCLQKTRAETQG